MENSKQLKDPREFLMNPENKIQRGTKHKLKFEILFKEAAIDGKTQNYNLSGTIPFLLEYGEYPKIPFYASTAIEQWEWISQYYAKLDKIKDELKDMFFETSQKKMQARCLFGILSVIIFSPCYHPNSNKFQLAFEAVVICFLLDDIFDSKESSSTVALNLPELFRIFESLQEGNIRELASISDALCMPNLTQALKMIEKIFNNIDLEIPGILKDLKHFWIRTINLIIKSQPAYSSSREEFLEQRSYVCGTDLGIEMRAASLGIKLDYRIRASKSFNEMFSNWNILCVILNDIVGLNLDQSKSQSKQDNSILKRKETDNEDIETAFQNTMTIFYQKWQNVVSQMKILDNEFSNDPNLQHFLRLLKELYDGLIYTYFGHGELRYGRVDGKFTIE